MCSQIKYERKWHCSSLESGKEAGANISIIRVNLLNESQEERTATNPLGHGVQSTQA